MAIRVALRHVTQYSYDRDVSLGPHVVRLKPAPQCRTPVLSYSLQITPSKHFINWQQDPHGNFLARLVFQEKTREFKVAVDLTVDLSVINPFDFFIEESAEQFPFKYDDDLARELRPYLELLSSGPKGVKVVSDLKQPAFDAYLKTIDCKPRKTIFFLVELNQKLWRDISYLIRMEPGVQSPEETLTKRSGSCRDSAWLLVQLLRSMGIAARFVSGYLIQLVADEKSLDGPSGPEKDFTDLHAWCEVFLPGAGWVGLDPTSGLLTGEGHIPLAASPSPETAAPISGAVDEAECEFNVEMSVSRVHEDPRVTKPYSDEQWADIDRLGQQVDERLQRADVRLTMGGEPTFVSIDDMEGAEWNVAAVGPEKQRLSSVLIKRLRERFAPGALLHFGQGKWYPGESLPRWAYSCFWRTDGEPIWRNLDLLADVSVPVKTPEESPGVDHAAEFITELTQRLEVSTQWVRPAYEDIWHTIEAEQKLPVDVDPREFDLDSDEDRRRLARVVEQGVSRPVGYVLPLTRAWWQGRGWASGPWPFRSEKLFLIPGDSPLGLRLPLDRLPITGSTDRRMLYAIDPFDDRPSLPGYQQLRHRAPQASNQEADPVGEVVKLQVSEDHAHAHKAAAAKNADQEPLTYSNVISTALCIELRNGRLHVFMPPLTRLEDYLELLSLVEDTAETLKRPVVIEGYMPPHDPRIQVIKVTPDPGVIEVNVHPARNWEELKAITTGVYEEARLSRLGTEKFQLDGKHTGTGGGNHIVMGGATPGDSPFLRRPDVLRSLVTYWNNHPALSYLFSGQFIGPTSQSPRVDEGRRDALFELEIACRQIPDGGYTPAWIVDRVFRNLLVDMTGNTHRAEICIDKLYSPDHATGRLGLVELRGFEMPPHARMSLTQQLLVRSLISWFWDQPLQQKLTAWGTSLHDRFMLPHFLRADLRDVLADLRATGIPFNNEWFAPHFEFRCPVIGTANYDGIKLELRTAIEPWYVLGEEPGSSGTTRYVDSSVERLQVHVTGFNAERYAVACNTRAVPLQSTGVPGEYVAGVRYRAWQPPSCLHPTIPVHTPLVFDIVDRWRGRSIGGCRYHVDHAGGLNSTVYPINALEAECRRSARFFAMGHTGGPIWLSDEAIPRDFPCTLDLRWS